jgi:hypothetical protein
MLGVVSDGLLGVVSDGPGINPCGSAAPESSASSTSLLLKERVIVRNLAFAIGQAALLVLFTPTSYPAAQGQFGTEKEAKAMLEKAVGALKENKEKALEIQQGRRRL